MGYRLIEPVLIAVSKPLLFILAFIIDWRVVLSSMGQLLSDFLKLTIEIDVSFL